MNILIVSQHFYPDNFRINDISAELAQRGHDVTVVTSTPDYATGFVPEEFKDKFEDNYKGVKVVRVKTSERRTGVKNRALNYLSFLRSSTKKIKRMALNCDVVFSYQTSPVLMAHAAIKAKKLTGKKLLLYCLDLWPESLKVWRVAENNPLFKIMHSYSKWAYNKADILAVSSKPFENYLSDFNNVPHEKISYLPQHCTSIDIPLKKREEKTVFAFGGNIGAAQDVECIIKAASLINDLDFCVEIYGDGSELQNCIELAKSLHADDRVHFHGRVSFEELCENYKNADAFLLTLKQNGAVGDTIPAKLQEYMSAGRPVFAAAGEGARLLIEESGCGQACDPSDSNALAEIMRDFILNPEKYDDCGQKGKNYYKENFTLDIFTDRLMAMFEEITN